MRLMVIANSNVTLVWAAGVDVIAPSLEKPWPRREVRLALRKG